ncbi:MAG: exodeoxyribonuclease V subunit alpha, partial [Rudaea sp.]|nr:exodeoxyribonuclease V subunit alpha [Rudaea sp.]
MKLKPATSATLDLFAGLATESLLDQLDEWGEAGWLRRLDSAFARFVARLAPASAPEVLLAAALLAHMEGRGHSCLALDELLAAPQELLGWPEEAAAALAGVLRELPRDWLPALVASTAVGVDRQPLVLDGVRLYLRRYWRYECQVAQAVQQRVAEVETIETAPVRAWLDRLFPSVVSGPDWQKIACANALRGRLGIITGGPGTGKTYTVARLLALLFATAPQPDKLRVALAAPTGKAAARLKQSIDKAIGGLAESLSDDLPLAALTARMGAARTLHSLLGARPDTRRLRHDAANPLDVDVLIVDEASMVHLEMMASLLAALPAQARLILLGDKDQLASVEAGAVLGDLCRDAEAGRYSVATRDYVIATSGETIPLEYLDRAGSMLAQQTVMLRESRRFGGPIGQLALAVNRGDADAAQVCLQASGEEVHWIGHARPDALVALALDGRSGAPGGYRSYLEEVRNGPQGDHAAWVKRVLTAFERFRILCALREGEWGVAGLNRALESALAEARLIGKRGEWYAGRPVMITRNDYGAGVFNGDIGIALPAAQAGAAMRVFFLDGDEVRSVLASRLAEVETAYAMTVHKSQGSEFEHTVLVLP